MRIFFHLLFGIEISLFAFGCSSPSPTRPSAPWVRVATSAPPDFDDGRARVALELLMVGACNRPLPSPGQVGAPLDPFDILATAPARECGWMTSAHRLVEDGAVGEFSRPEVDGGAAPDDPRERYHLQLTPHIADAKQIRLDVDGSIGATQPKDLHTSLLLRDGEPVLLDTQGSDHVVALRAYVIRSRADMLRILEAKRAKAAAARSAAVVDGGSP